MKSKPFHRYAYTIPPTVLAFIGLLDSVYLATSHYRNYTDIGYSSFCALSASINCDTVSQSPWSILFGLPLAVWGILAYLFFLSIALQAVTTKNENFKLWDFLFFLSLLYVSGSIYFFYLSSVKIKSYCLMCVISYAINLCLLFNTWIIRRRFPSTPQTGGIIAGCLSAIKLPSLQAIAATTLALYFVLRLFMPTYWVFQFPPLSKDIRHGLTEEGHPWIGAEKPTLVIHEFSDYQCFQCRKMHLILRYLVNEHADTIRIVHHNFPMDENYNTLLVKKPFHTGSGDLALLALAAAKQDKFWEANDAIYSIVGLELKEFNIIKFANKLSLDGQKLKQDIYAQSTLQHLEGDIRLGLKNGIIGTPSYMIDNVVHVGQVPADVLERATRP